MKHLIFIFALLFAVNITAQTTVTFYFNPQFSELSLEDTEKFATLLQNNYVVVIKGFANQLPNTVTDQANINLAHDRANHIFLLSDNRGEAIDVDWTVVKSNSSLDRRVEVTIVAKNTDLIGENTIKERKNVTLDEDQFAAIDLTDVDQNQPSSETASNQDVDDGNGAGVINYIDALKKADTLHINKVDTLVKTDTVVQVIFNQKSLIEDPCECSAANLGWIESRWKDAVEQAKFYDGLRKKAPMLSDDRKVFRVERIKATKEATNLRKCMETSRYKWKKQQSIQRELYKLNSPDSKINRKVSNVVAPNGATIVSFNTKTKTIKKKKNKRKKKTRRVRGNGLAKMSLVEKINLYLGTCFGN